MEIAQIECPFCKERFFRNLNASLLPRSKSHLCDKCIAKGLEEKEFKEIDPEEELQNKLYNPSQRKTSISELEEIKGIIEEEYLKKYGREPSTSEMQLELKKWIWLSENEKYLYCHRIKRRTEYKLICDKCGIHFGNGIMMSSTWKDGEINLCDSCYSVYKKALHHAFQNGLDLQGLDEYHFRIEFKNKKFNPSYRDGKI